MFEVELKYHCTDFTPFIEKLNELGADYACSRKQADIYFAHPQRDFGQTDEALRIRVEENKSALTYKGSRNSTRSQARKEHEVELSDHAVMVDILRELGFSDRFRVQKERDFYRFGDIVICFDKVKGLGNFIEIELMAEEPEAAENRIHTFAQQLGLKNPEKLTYLELILKKNFKNTV